MRKTVKAVTLKTREQMMSETIQGEMLLLEYYLGQGDQGMIPRQNYVR